MNPYHSLSGKTALITGGGTGLGFAIAEKFSEYGIRSIITGRRKAVLQEACKAIGKNISYRVNDITDLSSIPLLIQSIEDDIGPIDTLVNNAGIHIKKNMTELTDDDFQKVILTNQYAVFTVTREVAKKMEQRKSGNIVMISSMAAQYGIPKVIAYATAKSGIEGMTRALTVELSPLGIRVNCVAPGFIKTAMSQKALDGDPERRDRILSRTPLQKLGEPEDVADAVLYLVSDAAKYVTGVVLPVDGGNSIGF